MLIDLFADCKTPKRIDKTLTDETTRVIRELNKAWTLFNEVTDPYETESLIYRMKELETHYSYLIKEAKLGKIYNSEFIGGVNI
ncbi:MAG: DUF2508 family protein [Clostridia bacterium]|nr:DUF2508 family protein [Clostridia bacterium]